MGTKHLIVEIPENLKYRLDRHALERRSTIKETVIEILDKNIPTYKPPPNK